MGFRLVQKPVTLNDPEVNGVMDIICVILLNSVAFVANYVKVID